MKLNSLEDFSKARKQRCFFFFCFIPQKPPFFGGRNTSWDFFEKAEKSTRSSERSGFWWKKKQMEYKWVEARPQIEGNTILGQKVDQRHCSEVQESPMVPLKITIFITMFFPRFLTGFTCFYWVPYGLKTKFPWRVLAGHHFAGSTWWPFVIVWPSLTWRWNFREVLRNAPSYLTALEGGRFPERFFCLCLKTAICQDFDLTHR